MSIIKDMSEASEQREIAVNKIRGYTVNDVINAECTLSPMVCVYCGSNEVTFNQGIGDAFCSDCGEWQTED